MQTVNLDGRSHLAWVALRRNSLATKAWVGGYSPVRAQALTDRRRQRGRPHKLATSPELRATVWEGPGQGCVPSEHPSHLLLAVFLEMLRLDRE